MMRLGQVLALLAAWLPPASYAETAWLNAQLTFGGETTQAELRLHLHAGQTERWSPSPLIAGMPLLHYEREGTMHPGHWSVIGHMQATSAVSDQNRDASWFERYGWAVIGGVVITAAAVAVALDEMFESVGEALVEEAPPDGDEEAPEEPDCEGATVDTRCLP
ncbi:MAG: hypothetical protein VX549_00210 [Pseudomonadota bacterium]|nr:hypothetical protein [Pseudomonadota bacterium]